MGSAGMAVHPGISQQRRGKDGKPGRQDRQVCTRWAPQTYQGTQPDTLRRSLECCRLSCEQFTCPPANT